MKNTDMKGSDRRTRETWEAVALVRNAESENTARSNFKTTPEARCLDNSDAIFEFVADAIRAVRDGKAPDQVSAFAASELKRILATKTWTECAKYEVDYGLSDDAFDTAEESAVLRPHIDDVWTDEYGLWRQIVVALAAFLREAAAFAKRVGSVDAARRYILAWRKVNRLDEAVFEYMSQREADGVVNAIAEATDILWADMELSGL
jgi:hypothetical protein